MEQGYRFIAGTDEVGRGPFAGSVVAAAVVLNSEAIPEGLNDSKRLTQQRRETLLNEICACAHVGVACASARRVDAMNIRAASLWAMEQAVAAIGVPVDYVLVDGRDAPAFSAPCETLIKGDQRSLSIAAASIVAKVIRDRMMIEADKHYPEYGFASHKGYGTLEHRNALEKHGVCPLHRFSFKPIKDLLGE